MEHFNTTLSWEMNWQIFRVACCNAFIQMQLSVLARWQMFPQKANFPINEMKGRKAESSRNKTCEHHLLLMVSFSASSSFFVDFWGCTGNCHENRVAIYSAEIYSLQPEGIQTKTETVACTFTTPKLQDAFILFLQNRFSSYSFLLKVSKTIFVRKH